MAQTIAQMPQVAILLETTHGYSRDILHGILNYQNLYGPWSIYFEPGGSTDQKLPKKSEWKGNGIIAWVTNRHIEQNILSTRLPTVLIDPWEEYVQPSHAFSRFCQIRGNSYKVGQMAAQFYLEKQFVHFAYVGDTQEHNWSQDREKGFKDLLNSTGYQTISYTTKKNGDYDAGTDRQWLCRWLKRLPKPVGIFAATDVRGRQVLAACLQMGINVPQEVSVLGVDNDVLLCETANPPLSSIVLDSKNAGFLAAKLLDMAMKKQGSKKMILYDPVKIINRRSTDIIVLSDKLIIEALDFIKINSSNGLSVKDVVKHLGVSRRTIENRFKKCLGVTILEEIQKIRLNRIKSLICETDMPLYAISEMCGFDNESYMGKVFRKYTQMTMQEYRALYKKHNNEIEPHGL